MADWMTLAEAITANVHDGDTLAMEGVHSSDSIRGRP